MIEQFYESRCIMDLVCPLCNGMYEVEYLCPYCSNTMTDKGALVNYLDDYSPYLLDDISHQVDGAPYDKCVHLFFCPYCKTDKRVEIDRVIL